MRGKINGVRGDWTADGYTEKGVKGRGHTMSGQEQEEDGGLQEGEADCC